MNNPDNSNNPDIEELNMDYDDELEKNDILQSKNDDEKKILENDNDDDINDEDDDFVNEDSDVDNDNAGDDDDDDDDDDAVDDDDDELDKNNDNSNKRIPTEDNGRPSFMNIGDDMSDDDTNGDTDDEDENYLQKFDETTQKNIISEFYPELQTHNSIEIEALSHVVRNNDGIVIDPLHTTIPFITRYEKARIIGERAKQIEYGATPMVKVDANVIDGYLIALKEYEEKKIPFIIKRPLPNGGCEYWKFKDLEQL